MKARVVAFFAFIVLTSSICSSVSINASEKTFIDENIGQSVTLEMCSFASQLDCIQSIYVIHEDGSRKEAKFIPGQRNISTDAEGQVIDFANQAFEYEYERQGGEIRRTNLRIDLHTQKYFHSNGGLTLPGLTISFANSKGLIMADEVSDKDSFEFSIRTSWLIPLNVHLHARNALFEEKVITGGHLYKLTGSKFRFAEIIDPAKREIFSKNSESELEADRVRDDLSFNIDHYSKLYGTAFETKCASKGFTVESSNAWSSGQPRMVSGSEMVFDIGSPHTYPGGELVVGFYRGYVKKGWVDCKWVGNTFSNSSSFSVSVTDSNGVAQVATTSVKVEGDFIKIDATGFHYSKPTIKVVSNAVVSTEQNPSASPTISTAVKPQVVASTKSTIICIRGKVSKKVTATNPKCATGYKKKG